MYRPGILCQSIGLTGHSGDRISDFKHEGTWNIKSLPSGMYGLSTLALKWHTFLVGPKFLALVWHPFRCLQLAAPDTEQLDGVLPSIIMTLPST